MAKSITLKISKLHKAFIDIYRANKGVSTSAVMNNAIIWYIKNQDSIKIDNSVRNFAGISSVLTSKITFRISNDIYNSIFRISVNRNISLSEMVRISLNAYLYHLIKIKPDGFKIIEEELKTIIEKINVN